MSVKSGSKFIAGNLALKVQDRLFTAVRTLEGPQEYYDIIVPVGATLGFTEGTRLMVIIEGTNTTTTPILRYGATELYIVSSTMITNEAKIGELMDGHLMDMFIKSLSDAKPGTSTPMIYLGRIGSDYGFITNTPRFIGRNLNEKPLVAGLNYYTNLGLPYIEGNSLIVNDIDILSIDTNTISYGKPDFSQLHTFVSTNRINWRVSPTQIEELATLRDIAELAIADQFVDVLVYTRNTITLMNAIDDMVTGDTCLTLENNTIYNWNGTAWVIQEVLNYNLTTDNGKYFDIEDIDGDNSGKAIWNIAEGGRFRVFTDYSNSIDGITIIRNPLNRTLEVAKVPNSLTINNLDADGEVADTITFDGSSPQTFNVTIDFSNYYDKEDIDTWYNGATPGNISKFFTDTDGNVKLQDGNVVANDIVTKTSAGTYLQAQGSNVDASMIEFEDGSIEDFLGKDFAFVDVENDFVIGQSIAGELIATQEWAQNTFLPNNFDLNLLTGAAIQLNAPSAGRTSLRFARRNISSGATSNLDVELPIVNVSNNGIVTPAQVATWNTVSDKVDKELITGGLTSIINYAAGTPGIKSTYSDRSAEISIIDDGATNGLRASLLSLNITDGLYSGILADKSGVYAFQKEGIAKNNAHKIATQGYVEQNVVLQDGIVTDLNNQWSGNKVVLGAFDFTIIGASSATYRQYGSNVATGAQVTYDRSFPIVTNSTAGLATAGLFNQVETNRINIEALQGQGQVGAELPQPPSQSDIQNAWDTAKPTVTAVEGSSVVDLITGNTWRLLDVDGTLTWVNLGVLGGTGQATNVRTGVVKGSASGSGTIFVENDATMTVNGWDDVLSDIENLDVGLTTLDGAYTNHIEDIDFSNIAPHVTTQNRTDWNTAKTTADNAIPKVAAAVNNNLTMWSSGGVLKDSLLAIVTGFTTPTDSQVPTAKAVFDNAFFKIGGTITGETVIANDTILKLLEIKNQATAQYARMMFTGNQKQFTLGVGNSAAGITDLRNKFYVYDYSTSTPIMYGDQNKMKFSGRVGISTGTEADDAVNLGQMEGVVDTINNQLQTLEDKAENLYIWDGTIATSFAGGTGTENDPYLISNGQQLAYLASVTNNGTLTTTDKYFELTKDIILNKESSLYKFWETTPPENQWIPIGTQSNKFNGFFNGKGFYVDGLYIDTAISGCSLFGEISSSQIKNIKTRGFIKNIGVYTGGIVGTCNNSTISSCINECIMNAPTSAGGISGYSNLSNFINCINISNIESTARCGGILGECYYTNIINCFNKGNISGDYEIGGIIGNANNGSIVENCYNSGILTGLEHGDLIGISSVDDVEGQSTCFIKNSYYLTTPVVFYGHYSHTNVSRFLLNDQSLIDNIFINSIKYDDLTNALNAWVDYKQTSDTSYLNWVKQSGAVGDRLPILTTNYTWEDLAEIKSKFEKLDGIEEGAEVNVIETVKVNNVALTPTEKTVSFTVPTQASDIDALPDTTKYGATVDLTYTALSGELEVTLKDQDGTTLNSKKVDLPLELIITSGTVETCTVIDTPVAGYVVGDKYLDLVLANGGHIYVLVSDLVDQITITETGTGNAVTDISVIGNVITETKGKTFVETSLTINSYDLSTNRILTQDDIGNGSTYVQTENNLTDTLKTAYDGAVTDKHTHSNKATLDTYTQTEIDLASAVSLKHTHSNKAVLDSTTASYTTEEATKLSGIDENAEVNIIETVKVNNVALTPTEKTVSFTVPTQASDIDALPDTTKYGATIDLTYTASTGVLGLVLKDQNGDTLNSDTVDLPLELLIESGTVETCTIDNTPVAGYVIGDKYIDLVLANGTHIYILVSDLIDQITITETGTGNAVTDISINGSVITETKGKTFVEVVTGYGLSQNDLTDALKSNYDTAYTNTHTHSNKTTLDTYTQTETDLASAVSLKHTHSNKAVLDSTTASYTTEEATKLSSIDANAEVNVIETIKVNNVALTPTEKTVSFTVPTLIAETATLPYTSWTGASAPFTKAVTVSGVLATDLLDIDLDLSSSSYGDVATIQNDWANIYRAVVSADTITFYASEVPTIDIPLQIKGVR